LTLPALVAKALDFLTIAVPPIFPVVMTFSMCITIKRLRNIGVYCVSPAAVARAGEATLLCIDAEGTLVEDGFSFAGYYLVKAPEAGHLQPIFGPYFNAVGTIANFMARDQIPTSPERARERLFAQVLATCHSLALHDDLALGAREEKEMLVSTRASLVPLSEEDLRGEGLATIKMGADNVTAKQVRKHWWKERKLLSTIVRYSDQPDELWLYARAGVSAMAEICQPDALPESWKEHINGDEQRGYITYGICARRLQSADALHESWDSILLNMDLLGLVLFKSIPRPHAAEAITRIKQAKRPCKLLSDHSSRVALDISRCVRMTDTKDMVILGRAGRGASEDGEGIQWVMLNQAPMGEANPPTPNTVTLQPSAWSSVIPPEEMRSYSADNVTFVCGRKTIKHCLSQMPSDHPSFAIKLTSIFPNMYGENMRRNLISRLGRQEHSVVMVGSPASEYGLLSKSDVGVLITRTSQHCVLSAFACTTDTVASATSLIGECWAGLVVTYESFTLLALLGIYQLCTTILLTLNNLSLSDNQYLFLNVLYTFPCVVTLAFARRSTNIQATTPLSSLIGGPALTSWAGQIVIQSAFQVPLPRLL
jgi:cation-transporting ATPase 13A2